MIMEELKQYVAEYYKDNQEAAEDKYVFINSFVDWKNVKEVKNIFRKINKIFSIDDMQMLFDEYKLEEEY